MPAEGRVSRLDRALDVIADGRRRWEHTEWQLRMTAQVPRRIFEYNTLLVMASDSLGSDSVIVSLLREESIMESWVYKQGEQTGLEKGIQPARKTLVLLYEARFGAMALELRARVEAAHQPDLLDRWAEVVAHASKVDVDRALAEG
jgi:hypothetical protein